MATCLRIRPVEGSGIGVGSVRTGLILEPYVAIWKMRTYIELVELQY